MNTLQAAVLTGPAGHALYTRYRGYRDQRGARAPVALLACLGLVLAVVFLRLESRAWQTVLRNRDTIFGHISAHRMRIGDPLRYLIQILWLSVIRQRPMRALRPAWTTWRRGPRAADARETAHATGSEAAAQRHERPPLSGARKIAHRIFFALALVLAAVLATLSITEPFSLKSQALFVVLLWCTALLIRRVPGRYPTLLLIVMSLVVSCRYLWWRYTATLNWDSALDVSFGLLLVLAETYSWIVLVLAYVQSIWPLDRKPISLPPDPADWPTVDVFIATYNEDLSVVRPTVYAALGLDWPRDKLRVYVLDDGRRPEFAEFAREAGVNYLVRPDNRHAKSGNLNHAMTKTQGELIAVFDCDHIPSRSFLQLTVGWLVKDRKLALVQTPHHFYSPDPFERNLGDFRKKPNENILFYGLLQDGNDMWDATFFCGSCAVLRRSALESIGGFATETVTEDAHTSLRMHRKGYTSAYIRIPQAAGLATESLSAHIGQRMRWARGLTQIFRLDNPLTGPGLSLFQRLCYANSMLHFLAGLPRLVFLLAPLAYLFLHAYIIYAPAIAILLYVLPHLAHASLTTAHIQGKYRQTFWGEVYETVLAWYIAWPTTVALFNPLKGKFNVTAKGGLIEKDFYDWRISFPYLVLVLLNLAGLGAGLWRLSHGPAAETGTIIVSMLWLVYNLIILGAAVAVASEVRQVRHAHRVPVALPASLRLASGHMYPCKLTDYSENGVALETPSADLVALGQRVTLFLRRGAREIAFAGTITRNRENQAGVVLDPMSVRQQVDFVQCTFARADMWASAQSSFKPEGPLKGMWDVTEMAFRGYRQLAEHAPRPIRAPLRALSGAAAWIFSFAPRTVALPSIPDRAG